MKKLSWYQRLWRLLVFFLLGLILWFPLIRFCFPVELSQYFQPKGVAPQVKKLTAFHLRLWDNPTKREKIIAKMRAGNAEWDFMARTFLVWAMANLALREPSHQGKWLKYIDKVIDETVRLEKEKGMHFFLMSYSRNRPFVQQPARSQFLDGEIALMMGMRRLVQEHQGYRQGMTERVKAMAKRMWASPLVSVESYPNESWTFCNTISLVAMKIADVLDKTDHRPLIRHWIKVARAKLTDAKTGLLISAHTYPGQTLHGPEGSSIWMVAHNLLFLDQAFAKDQYKRARKELGRSLLGFGYAREWPLATPGTRDIDSGAVIPILNASVGSSGLALVGAAAFGDAPFLTQLLRSLRMAGFPKRDGQTLQFLASNQVGDAVMLYALVQGLILRKVRLLEGQAYKSKAKAKAKAPTKGSKGDSQ